MSGNTVIAVEHLLYSESIFFFCTPYTLDIPFDLSGVLLTSCIILHF